MSDYEDFKKVQNQGVRCGRFHSYMYTDGCYFYAKDNSFIRVNIWADKRGIYWKNMTEDDFNVMMFEMEVS